jgi:hypothetical protein
VGGGDRQAFGRLYDRIAPMVFGVVKRVVVDPAMSEEVAHGAPIRRRPRVCGRLDHHHRPSTGGGPGSQRAGDA